MASSRLQSAAALAVWPAQVIIEIEGMRYFVQNVPGDGNCFFHCLSLASGLNLTDSYLLRNSICGYVVENWEEWKDEVALYSDDRNTKQAYCIEMLNARGWATTSEIRVAAVLLNCRIKVWLKGTNGSFTLQTFNPNNPASTTVSLLLHNEHYQLLRPFVPTNRSVQTDNSNSSTTFSQPGASCIQSNRKRKNECNPEADPLITENEPIEIFENSQSHSNDRNLLFPHSSKKIRKTVELTCENEELECNKYDAIYEPPLPNETKRETRNRKKRNRYRINKQKNILLLANSNNGISELGREIPQPVHVIDTHCCENISKSNDKCTQQKHDVKTNCDNEFEFRKHGVPFEPPVLNESKQEIKNRNRRNKDRLKKQIEQNKHIDLPDPPPLDKNPILNNAVDSIRAFEVEQMSYKFFQCTICHERRLQMLMANSQTCKRCDKETLPVKLYSAENNVIPGKVPQELSDLSVIEEQLICRISPCINVHMLKHGGIASSGHCVTFPQEVNEPAQIFPRLPNEIQMLKVRKIGLNNTSKEFRVRRFKVQSALLWLKANNLAYSDIVICDERLSSLPIDDFVDVNTLEYKSDMSCHQKDTGPASEQIDLGDVEGETHSSILLPDQPVDIRKGIQAIVDDVVIDNPNSVTVNKQGTVTIPWPTRGNAPLSEFTTHHFFTLAFPTLFPFGSGDFFVNRPRSISSLADWADHLLWYEDGRFAHHSYFKFVVHNMIMRRRALENSSYIVQQQLGEQHFTISDLKEKIQTGDNSIGKKILYFGANLRGTSQYWAQRGKELRSLIQYQINEGKGLPAFFTTGSCAEYHFKPLSRLLQMYVKETSGSDIDLSDRTKLFETLQQNTHIVAHYSCKVTMAVGGILFYFGIRHLGLHFVSKF